MASNGKIRVSFFLQDFNGGGAERAMVNLYRGMKAADEAVELVVVRNEGAYAEQLAGDPGLVELPCNRTFQAIWPMSKYLKKTQPDAVISVLPHVNVAAVLAAKLARTGTKVYVSEQNNAAEIDLDEPRPVRMARKVIPWVYPRATCVLATTAGVADSLASVYKLDRDAMQIIGNPIVDDVSPRQEPGPPSHPWLVERDGPVVVAMGRLVPQKDFGVLLQAFAKVREAMPAKLIIFGEGPLREQLQSQIDGSNLTDVVSMPGFVDQPLAELKAADLFVMSSAWEGFGNVLVEALWCGTPVVSTDCPSGPAEILKDGEFGKLVPVGDADGLSAAIIETLNQTADPQRLMQRADDFSISKITQQYLTLLDS